MKMKNVALSKLNLRYHPTVEQITSHEHFTLGSAIDIQALSLYTAQTLLNLSPLLVCQSPEDKRIDWQLNPNPTVALLKLHPDVHKLTVTLHYYPQPTLSDVLIGALLLAPALTYRQQKRCLNNLCHRIEQAKLIIPMIPSKKELATWAEVKPSALRKEKQIDTPKEEGHQHG